MKKQIFILAMFTLALFAGINSTYGQKYKNVDTDVWAAPNCATSDAYHPAAGVPSTYSVGIAGTGYNGDGTYTWKVTNNLDLLAASTVPATEFTKTSGGAAADNNIVITWDASSIGKTYYVVVNYQEQNSTNTACTINNVKVFPVQPRNAFWLDINASTDVSPTNIAVASATVPFNICAPNVSSATITTPGDIATARVKYEFGVTTLYAIVHAAGYTGNFNAKLTISGLAGSQKAAVPTGWTATASVDGNGNGDYTNSLASVFGGSDIPVTIVITNNQHEILADQEIKVTIDGTYTSGGTTFKDLYNGGTDCIDQPDDADYVYYTVKARPTITPTSPAGFATPNPALD